MSICGQLVRDFGDGRFEVAFSVEFKAGLVTLYASDASVLLEEKSVKEARAILMKRNNDQEKRLFESLLQVALGDPEQAAVIRRGSSTRMLKPVLDAEGNVILPSRSQET
jgi:AmiR/NasT family two-component response regulator